MTGDVECLEVIPVQRFAIGSILGVVSIDRVDRIDVISVIGRQKPSLLLALPALTKWVSHPVSLTGSHPDR